MAAGGPKRKEPQDLRISLRDAHARLRARYGVDKREWAEKAIREAYKRGLLAELSSQTMSFLKDEFPTHAAIADYLGVERTSISKMKSSRSIAPLHLALVIARNDFRPDRQLLTRSGLIEAATCARRIMDGDKATKANMTAEDYIEIIDGAQNDWYEAFVLAVGEVEDMIR